MRPRRKKRMIVQRREFANYLREDSSVKDHSTSNEIHSACLLSWNNWHTVPNSGNSLWKSLTLRFGSAGFFQVRCRRGRLDPFPCCLGIAAPMWRNGRRKVL